MYHRRPDPLSTEQVPATERDVQQRPALEMGKQGLGVPEAAATGLRWR